MIRQFSDGVISSDDSTTKLSGNASSHIQLRRRRWQKAVQNFTAPNILVYMVNIFKAAGFNSRQYELNQCLQPSKDVGQ